MKNNSFLVFFTILVLTFGSSTNAKQSGEHIGRSEAEAPSPAEIVAMFESAVARGELVIFGETLDLSMIHVSRVEFVFDLDRNASTVKVFADLVTSLESLQMTEGTSYGICAIMSRDGHIMETEVHVGRSRSHFLV